MDRTWVEDGEGEHGINEIMSFGIWKKKREFSIWNRNGRTRKTIFLRYGKGYEFF